MRRYLHGHRQSCETRSAPENLAVRIYDAKLPGIGPIELHMGPYHEFALFRGVQDAHRDHSSAANLLWPFDVQILNNTAHQKWDAAGLDTTSSSR